MLFEAKEGSRTKTWSSLRLRRHRRRRCRRRCDWRRRNPRGCSARGGIGRPESHLLQHRDQSRPHPGEIQVQQVTNLFFATFPILALNSGVVCQMAQLGFKPTSIS